MIKILLDDAMEAPPGWTLVRRPDEAIVLMKTQHVEEICIALDLVDDAGERQRTEFDVLVWMEKAVATWPFAVPRITIRSASAAKMECADRVVASIRRLQRERGR